MRKFFEAIKNMIVELYEEHIYLSSSEAILSSQQALFDRFLNKTATMGEYKKCLKLLSQILYQHTGKKVYVLIDEYDTPPA